MLLLLLILWLFWEQNIIVGIFKQAHILKFIIILIHTFFIRISKFLLNLDILKSFDSKPKIILKLFLNDTGVNPSEDQEENSNLFY